MGKRRFLKQIKSFEDKTMSILSNKISPTWVIMLNELRHESLSTIKLIHQLELEHLTDEQIEDVLGDLTASLTHLQTHSAIVNEELNKQD